MAPPTADLPKDKQEGVQFALKLSRALHIYGAPANRLEAVMNVLSQEMGLKAHSMAMPTALMVSFDLPGEDGYAHLYRLHRNEQDFDKLARLDQLWNEVVDKRMTPADGIRKIDEIDEQPPLYGRALQMLCFGLSSAAASIFFGGGPNEMILAGAAGFVLGLFLMVAGPRQELLGLHELLGAALVAVTAAGGAHIMDGADADVATLAGLIVLLPGFSMTIAVSELAQRNLVSGTARLAWSALLLMMLTFGVLAGRTAIDQLIGITPYVDPGSPWKPWVTHGAIGIAGVTLGILFQAQKRDLPWITLAVFAPFLALQAGIAELGRELGVFLSALIVGAGSNLYARALDRPATITRLPGILVLVPGSLGFLSITELMKDGGDPLRGLQDGFAVFSVALALVTGLLVSNAIIPPRKAL
ncbi:MAG: threonine/serine exporter family protein [Planctomycetes bacterium]|nr:threonine/serine exporter family protein [Planctomycetota bacterium]